MPWDHSVIHDTLFIFMGYVSDQAGLMERLFKGFQFIPAPVRGSLYLGGR